MRYHKLLAGQLRRALGVASGAELRERLDGLRARGDAALADGLTALFDAVGHSYACYERDLQVRTRMLDISSDELTGANTLLRAEAARQREVLLSLQASVQRLTFDAPGGAPSAPAAGFDDDLLALTQALEQVVQQRATARELTEQILDQLPIPVFLKDRDGRLLRFNRHFEQFWRRSGADLMGKHVDDFAAPDWAGASCAEDVEAWASGRMVSSERRRSDVDPPMDFVVNRVVIASGGESYLLGFSIDMSEQRAAREAMQRAVESAQAANLAKSEFLANMSHEIRTPMNGILGMTELVLASVLAPEQRADLALVKASADALLTIVDDILDFSKIEAGKLDLEEVPFDLHKLVQETVRSMALRAQQKGLALRCALPADVPQVVRGDPGRLRQVLLNLLGNAIKFTVAGEVALTLWAGRETGELREIGFAVSDTGIGIAPEKQKLVFEAFSQVDGSTTREYGGTGLGLTICRRLVILMQGQLTLRSAPGAGSVFSFSLLLRQSGALPAASAPAGETALAVGARCDDAGAAGALHILLAEDNPVNQRLALRLLEKMGHRVTLVDNGVDALARAQDGGFDLILMDVQMPGLDGLSATRRLRQWELHAGGHVPVVAMTARAMRGDRERCLDAGMDDYLSKPIDSERLRLLVGRYTAQAQAVLAWRGALQRLDGDAGLLLELAALFLDDGPQLRRALQLALDAGEQAGAQRELHSLMGVLVNFGAQCALDEIEALAALLRAGAAPEQWRPRATSLDAALEAVYAALRARIAAGPDAA